MSDDRCEGCGLIPDYCACDLPSASAFVDYTQRLAESEEA